MNTKNVNTSKNVENMKIFLLCSLKWIFMHKSKNVKIILVIDISLEAKARHQDSCLHVFAQNFSRNFGVCPHSTAQQWLDNFRPYYAFESHSDRLCIISHKWSRHICEYEDNLKEILCLWQRLSPTSIPTSLRLTSLPVRNARFTQNPTSICIPAFSLQKQSL